MTDLSYYKKRIPVILELGFSENLLPKLQSYVELLWASNEELNLISRKMTMEELIDNHVIDSLLPLKLFPAGVKTVADFGTGGGLPAVIYAIQFPNIKFKLFEKSKMKQDFLSKCRSIAPNIEVAGDIPLKLINIDLVTARAFKPIDVMLDMSRDYFTRGGKYFLLKARMEKIEEELRDAKKKFKTLAVEIVPLKSPVLEVERNLVLF